MKILVACASGTVGRSVMESLRGRADVRALVHASIVDGVENVRGDLGDRASLDHALAGVDGAVFVTPHGPDELHHGLTFVAACKAARIRRLVYVSAFHPLARSRIVQRILDAAIGLIGPHYRAKLAVERAVRASGLAPVILCPTNFYQNDAYGPQPLGDKRINRVDARDIGDAVARAFTDDIASGSYPLVGPDASFGTYDRDIARWLRANATMSPAKAADFAKTFRVIQRWGVPTSARQLAQTTALLGRAPRSYAAFAVAWPHAGHGADDVGGDRDRTVSSEQDRALRREPGRVVRGDGRPEALARLVPADVSRGLDHAEDQRRRRGA